MAKGYDKGRSTRRGGDDFFTDPQAVITRKLGEIVSDLYLSTDESDIKRLWTSAHRNLLKTSADPARIEAIMKQRRVGALSTLVQELTNASTKGTLARTVVQNLRGQPPASAASPGSAAGLERSGATPTPQPDASVNPEQQARVPSSEQLKSAMKAFRKRLKLTRLDDESKLGTRAMSSGRQSKVVAILPPREYPIHVWQELARQGKLRESGGGFFELVGE